MQADMWKRKIGESAWDHLVGSVIDLAPDGEAHNMVATILDRAVECGWRPPEREPRVDPKGTKVLWPGEGRHEKPVVTAKGLLN